MGTDVTPKLNLPVSEQPPETLVDIHRSLTPRAQKWLQEQDSKTHHEYLENMRTMDPGARMDYLRPQIGYDKDFEKGYQNK